MANDASWLMMINGVNDGLTMINDDYWWWWMGNNHGLWLRLTIISMTKHAGRLVVNV